MAKKKSEETTAVETVEITKIESEIKPLQNETALLRAQAEAMVIDSDEAYASASDALDVVNSNAKALDKMRKFFTDPLNQQVKNINGMFKPKISAAEEVVGIIKGKMGDYYKKKEEARVKEEKRLEAIRAKADEKRLAEGKEVIAEPVREVAAPTKTVVTGTSKAQVRKFWTHEIQSIDALPDDVKKAIFAEAYKKGIITSVVQKFVDAGMREITGVRIYEDVRIATGNVRAY